MSAARRPECPPACKTGVATRSGMWFPKLPPPPGLCRIVLRIQEIDEMKNSAFMVSAFFLMLSCTTDPVYDPRGRLRRTRCSHHSRRTQPGPCTHCPRKSRGGQERRIPGRITRLRNLPYGRSAGWRAARGAITRRFAYRHCLRKSAGSPLPGYRLSAQHHARR